MSSEPALVAESVAASGGIGALGINLQLFVAQLIHFLVVLLIFWKWIYGPIVKMLDARRGAIEKGLSEAKAHEEARAAFEQQRTLLVSKARDEASQLVAQAAADAEAHRDRVLKKTKEEISQLVENGKKQLVADKQAMLTDARGELADLAVQAAKHVLASSVDEKTARTLADKSIKVALATYETTT